MRLEVEWAEMRERHRHGESVSKLEITLNMKRNEALALKKELEQFLVEMGLS